MQQFVPKKKICQTVIAECLSRMALIVAFFFISYLNYLFIIPIIFFAAFKFIAQRSALEVGSEAKKNLRYYFQNIFLNILPVRERSQKGMPLQELSMHYMKTAEIMEPWYSRFLPSMYIAVIVPVIILFVMFFIDKITFMVLLFTGILLPVFLFLIGKIAKQKSEVQWQHLSKLRAFFLESLQGFKTIKIFKKVKEREKELEFVEDEFSEKTLAVLKTAFLSALVQEWAASLSIALVAVALSLRLIENEIDFRTAFLILLVIPEFYKPIRQFGTAFHASINAKTAWKDKNINQTKCEVEKTEAKKVFYLSSKTNGLKYITEPSGSGKTRMVLEMLGHIEENSSEMKLFFDGDKKNIAWMPQNPGWFKGSLLENICVNEQRTFLDVKTALERVNLGHFTERLNETVQEYASNFSGGEKRRLAIARIILLNRPVWILDEPFAGLDKKNIKIIENLLEEESKIKSILCITHHA